MTKVIGIDCHKWLRVIGITLWSGLTIGMAVVLYLATDYLLNGYTYKPSYCDIIPGDAICISGIHVSTLDIGIYVVPLILNIINWIGIWLVINNHYKFVELKCTSYDLPMTYSSPDKIVSNDEYFKQQNPNEVKQE